MKLRRQRLYEGDSILRAGSGIVAESVAEASRVDSTPDLMQRGGTPDAAVPTLDAQVLEVRARALRARVIAGLARSLWGSLGERLQRVWRRRDEEYLARAQNLAELEHRLRKLDRHGDAMHV